MIRSTRRIQRTVNARPHFKPPFKKGVCRLCGCTQYRPCTIYFGGVPLMPCAWADKRQTICTAHPGHRIVERALATGEQQDESQL